MAGDALYDRKSVSGRRAFVDGDARYPHEVRQHVMAMFGGDAFRVELDRVDRQVAVAEAHDGAVLAGGVDDQGFGNVLVIDILPFRFLTY